MTPLESLTPIRTVAVAGCGTMGIGIAIVAARGGCETVLYDSEPSRIVKARDEIAAFLAGSVRRGKLSDEAADEILRRLHSAHAIDALTECDLVIEAIFESAQAKADLFNAINPVCNPDAIFATNTSTLSITQLAAVSGRPENFVGLHFCLPAQIMKLVEVTPGLQTAPPTVDRALEFCRATGQIAIETKDRPGFILNHFAIPLNNRAIRMVEENIAAPADIDRAMKVAMGFPIGPLELVDLVGLDTQERLCDSFYAVTNDPELACPPLVRRMVAAGRLGKKAGRGFYDYAATGTFGT